MFKLARGLIRHKIGVIAVIAFAVVMFSGDGDAQVEPSSPWAKNAPAAVAAPAPDESSVTARLGEVANSAGEYAAEKFLGDKDLNPVKMGEDTVGRFEETSQAMARANGNPAD